MSEHWDPLQREWLEAMGLQLWSPADDESVAPAVERAPAPPAVEPPRSTPGGSVRSAPPIAPLPPPPRPAPAQDTADARIAPARDRNAHAAALARALPDRLMRGVLRAAGVRPEEGVPPDIAEHVDTARLRLDPAAKRALWPWLRARRRTRA